MVTPAFIVTTPYLRDFLRRNGVITSETPAGYHRDSQKKPDFLIHGLARTICVDLSVAHAAAESTATAAASTDGAAAKTRETAKMKKHEAAAKTLGHEFVPLVFESLGRPGPAAKELINRLTSELPVPLSFARSFWLVAAAALQRGNAEIRQHAAMKRSSAYAEGRPRWLGNPVRPPGRAREP